MKEKIKDLLGYMIIILIGVGFACLMMLRVEQIEKEVNREKVSKAILDIMY